MKIRSEINKLKLAVHFPSNQLLYVTHRRIFSMNSQDIAIQSWSPPLLVVWRYGLRINWSVNVQRTVFHVEDDDSYYPSADCLKCFVTLTATETTKNCSKQSLYSFRNC